VIVDHKTMENQAFKEIRGTSRKRPIDQLQIGQR